MVQWTTVALIMILLGGCASAPVETLIPVPVSKEIPAELSMPVSMENIPEFVSPADPAATSALKPEDEIKLKLFILDLVERDIKWRVWAGDNK